MNRLNLHSFLKKFYQMQESIIYNNVEILEILKNTHLPKKIIY